MCQRCHPMALLHVHWMPYWRSHSRWCEPAGAMQRQRQPQATVAAEPLRLPLLPLPLPLSTHLHYPVRAVGCAVPLTTS